MHRFLHLMPDPIVWLNHEATEEDLKWGNEYLYDYLVTNSLCYLQNVHHNVWNSISYSPNLSSDKIWIRHLLGEKKQKKT